MERRTAGEPAQESRARMSVGKVRGLVRVYRLVESLDPLVLDELAHAAVRGDRGASRRLSLAVWPFVMSAARRSAPGQEAADEAHELYALVLEKLEGDAPLLAGFRDWSPRHPEKTFADWVRIVVKNLARDRYRAHAGRCNDDLPSPKRLLNELASLEPVDDLSFRPPVTSAQTAREILEFASSHLPPVQARALRAWTQGESFADLAGEPGLDDEAAAIRAVRAALATLRRRFAAS